MARHTHYLRHHLIGAAAIVLMATNLASAWAEDEKPDPKGRWITASGNLEVDIAPCGQALCGTVTKVLANRSMSREGEDMKPVDTRPALGMKILIDLKQEASDGSEPARWSGQIYNRENGKTYRCLMSLDASGGLVLRPYVGLPLFGRTQVWRRAEDTATSTGAVTRPGAAKEGQP